MLNLENISVGDKVAYMYGYGRNPQFSKVEKVFKLRIKLVNDLEFSRKNGQLTGRNFCGKNGYLVDVEDAEKVEQAQALQRAKKSAARELVTALEGRYAPAGNVFLTTAETEAIKALTLLLKANRDED